MERNLQEFFTKTTKILLYIFTIFIALEAVHIDTSSIAGILGTSTIAMGIAVRSQVSNAMSGLILIFTKQLKLGDRLEVDGEIFRIEKIDIFSTTLKTKEKKIIMPNKKLVDEKQTLVI